MSTRSMDQIIAAIAAWMDPHDEEPILAELRAWDAEDWMLAQKGIFLQGIGPFLHQSIPSTSRLASALPAELRRYLADQLALNAQRITRVHEVLSTILAKANHAGIQVMPLKGSLLTTQGQLDATFRPMADIDLLIQPADLGVMDQLLKQSGYQRDSQRTFYKHHEQYSRPEDRVVSWSGEHPDNPIPIEIHTNLRRILWANTFTPDFAPLLWDRSRAGEILGQSARIPSESAHYAYLCLHAMVHLLAFKGRLVHWIDLARLSCRVPDFSHLPFPVLLYPAIRLAGRVLPGDFNGVALEPMARHIPAHVREWADTIAIDSRCGLMNYHRHPSWWEERSAYWNPTPIRMALAYPGKPLPLAMMVFIGNFFVHLAKYARDQLADLGKIGPLMHAGTVAEKPDKVEL